MEKIKCTLKGSKRSMTNYINYANPDILYSVIGKHKCFINRINFSNEEDPLNHYIYHSYTSVKDNWTGRWYNLKFKTSNMDIKKNMLVLKNVIINYDDDPNSDKVDIKVILTQIGMDKFKKYLSSTT